MRDPFLHQLAGLCRTHVMRAKWAFVPSHAIGRTLSEQMAIFKLGVDQLLRLLGRVGVEHTEPAPAQSFFDECM